MFTDAVAPANRPVGVPVTEIVTGNVVTPDVEEPSSPTDETVPYCGVEDPCGMITACSPALTSLIWVPSMFVFTTNPVLRTTICAEDAPVAEPLPPAAEPLPP